MSNYVPLHRKGNTVVTMNGARIPRTKEIARMRSAILHGSFTVTLYQTEIVRYEDGVLTLDTGGYNTVTTRARMNQFLQDYLGFRFGVCVQRGQIYLVPQGHQAGIPFDRRITVAIDK